MSSEAISDWKNYIKEGGAVKIMHNENMIGVEDVIVQIEEALFDRWKCQVDKLVREQWIFGDIDCC